VLDALVAEARLRWGLDLAAGLQVIAAERLVATPLEPSRPALIVPLAVLRAEVDGGAPPELDQPRLVRVQLQPEPREPFA